MAKSCNISVPIFLGKSSFDKEFQFMNKTAKTSGLTSDYLLRLCSWIESEEVAEKPRLKLIECLIPVPNGTIPEEVCIRLAYLLKSSQTTIATKVEIFKWMICAHSFMETSGKFQMLYDIFFMFLKNKELRTYAAHFLCLITQRKHVTFNRVKCLLRFENEYGHMPCFTMLLRTFSLHAPEYDDPEFDDESEEECELKCESLGSYPYLIKKVHHTYSPKFSNNIITTSESSSTSSAVITTEVDLLTEKMSQCPSCKIIKFQVLYKQFRALERSTDISKILDSKLRRLFFTSRLEPVMKTKLQDYITALLHNSFESEDIVEKHFELFRNQHSLPCISEFTEFLLLKEDWSPDTAEVMSFEPICCFKKIKYKLQVIRGKFLSTEDIGIKCQWLNSLSKMFCYWILQSKKSIPCDGKCNEDDKDDAASDIPLSHIPTTEINQLGSEIDFLCDSLIMKDCSPFVLSQILQHYQMGAVVRQLVKTLIPCFPSPSVFQLSLFSLTPFLLETLSGFMLRMNTIYDLKKEAKNDAQFVIFQASVNDVKKVFLGGSYKSENTYLAKTKTFKILNERNSDFTRAFILHKHPALLLMAIEFGDGNYLQDVFTGPESKQRFLLHLAEKGYKDLARLISKIK